MIICRYILLFFILLLCTTSFAQKKKSNNHQTTSQTAQIKQTDTLITATVEALTGSDKHAAILLQRILTKEPDNDAALYQLSKIKAHQGHYKEALSLSKKACKLDDNNKWYKLLTLDILQQLKKFDEAGKIYQELIRRYPYNTDYYLSAASMYLYAGDFQKALDIFDQEEKQTGLTKDIGIKKHQIYLSINKPDKAIEALKETITKYPHDVQLYNILANLYLKENKFSEAKAMYDSIIKTDPNNEFVHISLSEYYWQTGNKEKAFQELSSAFANPVLSIDTKVSILLSYYQISARDSILKEEAYQLCALLIKAHPQSAKAYSVWGDFLYRDKQYEKARTAYRKVIELDNDRYPVWEQLLAIESELQDYNAMVKESEEAISIFPEQAMLYLFNGIGLNQTKKYQDAIHAFKKGLTIVPTNHPLREQILSYLADVYYQADSISKAYDTYRQVLDINPDNAYVLNNYAYYLSLDSTSLEEALKMADRANKLKPDDNAYEDTYGWVLYKLRKYHEAEKWIHKALEHGGDSSGTILEHYGDILYKLNKKEESLKYWERALQTGERSPLLEKKIKDATLYE